jgi:hypothetical protein
VFGNVPRRSRYLLAISDTQTIYVELLEEGITVYRPVEATPERDGSFRFPDSAPADERWGFEPGSRVICERQQIERDGEVELVATRQAP